MPAIRIALLISARGLVNVRATGRLEGLENCKKYLVTPLGSGPTFKLILINYNKQV
jgi:hypothetical protein